MRLAAKKNQLTPHYIGHRKRLKNKFLQNGDLGLNDYELLELILFQAIPRRDVKELAKKLLDKFTDFQQLVNVEKEKLMEVNGVNENVYLQIRLLKVTLNRIFKEKITKKNIISSWSALLDYLKATMEQLRIEQFRVLFLNKRNSLIDDLVMGTGTIDQAPVYPREIVKKALYYEAAALILVHNHPSGNSQPSNADIELTKQIVTACKIVDVAVHDHVIIGDNEYYSFKSNLLL